MVAERRPYPVYKSSGVEGLGNIPAHWKVQKLRGVLTEVTERNRPDWPLLSVVREKGVILRDVTDMDENHNFIPDDLTNYKKPSENSGCHPLCEEKGLGSRASRPMKNAQCEGRLATLEAARRGFSDSF